MFYCFKCEALKYFEDKSKKYNPIQRQDIHEKWQNHLINRVNNKEVAVKVAAYVSKYNSNPTVAEDVPAVNPKVKKIKQELKEAQEQVVKVSNKLETVITRAEQEKQIKELEAKHEAESEQLKTEHKAELEKVKVEFNAKLEALKPKASPTKDAKVDEVGSEIIYATSSG